MSKVGDRGKILLFNSENIQSVDSRVSKGVQIMKLKVGSVMTAVRKLNEVKLYEPEYYRTKGINVVGNYLKKGDKI